MKPYLYDRGRNTVFQEYKNYHNTKEVQSKLTLENNNSNTEGGREGGRPAGGVDALNLKYRKKNALQTHPAHSLAGWTAAPATAAAATEMRFSESAKTRC